MLTSVYDTMIKKIKKKKKFKIVEPIKETQIIDYIPDKQSDNGETDVVKEEDIPDEEDYLNECLSEDDEDNIQILEESLFNDNNDDDSKEVETIDILSNSKKTKGYQTSYGDLLEKEKYNY